MLSGVTFPVLADLLRGLFVDIAVNDLLPDAAARTDSRISLLTGVHRKEIRRLRLAAPAPDSVPDVVTVSSQIIGTWAGNPAFCDTAGMPLALPRVATAAGGPSFEALVESVTTDIRPRAVLDDFIAQGLVTLAEDDTVRLNRPAFIPSAGSAEQIFFFARNLHDHIAAAAANVLARQTPPYLDSSVHYDRLDPESAARLLAIAQASGQRALLEVNRAAVALISAAPAKAEGPAGARVNFGIYIYTDDEPPPP
jgi:hypothetical protein